MSAQTSNKPAKKSILETDLKDLVGFLPNWRGLPKQILFLRVAIGLGILVIIVQLILLLRFTVRMYRTDPDASTTGLLNRSQIEQAIQLIQDQTISIESID